MEAPKRRFDSKITNLNNQYIQEQQEQEALAKHQRFVRRVHRRRLLFLGVLVLIFAALLGNQWLRSQRTQRTLQANIAVQQQKLKKAQQQQEDLQIQVDQLHDADYLDKLIRYKYDYSKKGEVIFTLPDNEGQTTSSNPKN
ncbi:septum formation initiator family protein [Lapidilactobacillus achengensis]|uniref:Septum formation initiator family protein n=1 Tax=Lapidilactobacillus achengensis TaxID=2486000 RepID=A0ABW1UR93_9LACO|nr:septum formation initiator family protein [Lapidilactobacillus achengensis]